MTPTATLAPHAAAPRVPAGRTTIDDLFRAADRFGQMELGDPRWAVDEPLLDHLLERAVELSDHTRAKVWGSIAADPDTPLVVRLRTFSAAVGSLRAVPPGLGTVTRQVTRPAATVLPVPTNRSDMPTTNRPRHAVETESNQALGLVPAFLSRIPLVPLLIVTAAVLVLMAVAVPVWGASADLQRSDVHRLSDLSTVQGASAQLTRTDSGVSFNLRTSGFEPGHVATVWWVVFNNPDECNNPIPAIGANCNLPDLFDPDVQAAVMFAAGNVVGQSGRTSFAGHLQRGQVTTTHPLFPDSPGLLHPRTAEIHLVDRTHGPLIPELAQAMLTTFEGGCTPATSAGSGDGPNDCADLHAAAFPAP